MKLSYETTFWETFRGVPTRILLAPAPEDLVVQFGVCGQRGNRRQMKSQRLGNLNGIWAVSEHQVE